MQLYIINPHTYTQLRLIVTTFCCVIHVGYWRKKNRHTTPEVEDIFKNFITKERTLGKTLVN